METDQKKGLVRPGRCPFCKASIAGAKSWLGYIICPICKFLFSPAAAGKELVELRASGIRFTVPKKKEGRMKKSHTGDDIPRVQQKRTQRKDYRKSLKAAAAIRKTYRRRMAAEGAAL